MADKILNGRIQQKHDIEANWTKAANFIPKVGEIIVYDRDGLTDFERIKIGDGITNVNELPFISPQADWNQNDPNAADYVKNRTHYVDTSRVQMGEEFQPAVWVPFKPEGVVDSTNIGGMVKVSDLTPEVDTLITTGSAYPDSTDNAKYTLQQTTTTDYGVTLATATSRGVQKYNAIAIVYQAGHAVCSNYDRRGQENSEYYAVLNEPGIYVNYGNAGVPSDLHIDHLTWGETVPLDEKYIPSSIARVSDIPDATIVDPTLTIEGAAADAKVVGDLWNSYPIDADVWGTLIAIGMYERIADETGAVLTDENGAILLL